jgi:ribosomal protein S18 acetylase RimI-like enzyme
LGNPFSIDIVRPEELTAAFALVFQHLAAQERDARVARALALAAEGDIETEGIVVARTAAGLQGAFVTLLLAGASGLVWPPGVRPGPGRQNMEDDLIRAGCAALHRRGAKLAHASLATEEIQLAAPLQRNAFTYITQLHYLRHALENLIEPTEERLTFVSYAVAAPQLFQQTLLRTYEDTQDCPELNDVRTIEEIIQGHAAQGIFDPSRWWLALEGDGPVGVLLLTQPPDMPGWDLSYLGVVPEKRGRGFGRALTQKALREAQLAGVGQLTLAVDVRNYVAAKMYADLGFELTGTREIYLSFFTR